jgi:hypothetical protein
MKAFVAPCFPSVLVASFLTLASFESRGTTTITVSGIVKEDPKMNPIAGFPVGIYVSKDQNKDGKAGSDETNKKNM